MGRSTSCFKIITCGSDSVENNDAIDVPQNNRSSDKKGWSFRKRSERHRVLSNTMIQEATSGLKESPESAGYVQQSNVSIAPEKTTTIQYTEEKPQLLTQKECVEEKPPLVEPKEYGEEKSQLLTREDSKLSEHVVATTNEAKDDADMDESVVLVIQTAIRGFLAQKELGKLKNLVKLQAAIRGHLVRRHAVGTLRCVQAIVKMQLLVRARHSRLSEEGSYHKDSQSLGNSASSTSIEKLLSNRFARQLMDSTPKAKPIHVSCDPSKPSSAWSWLERWMSVSSSGKVSTAELPIKQPGREKGDSVDYPLDATVSSEAVSEPNDLKSDVSKILVSSVSEEALITYDAANSKVEACQPTSSSVTGDLEQIQIDNMSASDQKETSLDQTMQTDAHSSKSIDSSLQDVGIESNLDTVSSGANTTSRSEEPSITRNPVLSDLKGQLRGSECGTELSVTSTVDSPDRCGVGTVEYENGTKENDTIAIAVPDSSPSAATQPKKLDDTRGESESVIVVDSPRVEQEPESKLPKEQDSEKGNQACRSSPEASPRSHMTIPESLGTPSSQVLKTKKKNDRSSQKRKSLSTAKGSPSTATHDSGVSSMEQSSKDQKSGKRRNSFGSTRPENNDEETSDNNSSNSVPRFMQATESARAKLNANNSPRSSPDVHDKDIYIKKRRSLPGASGKQHSPRIQLSPSQAQKGGKGNSSNPLNDRRWQR